MRISLFSVLVICSLSISLQAQSKYFTKKGNVVFFSETPVENIEAVNKKGTSVLDINTGKIEWAVLIKAFQFEKALMQEHFNENYMESNTFPKATFVGQIVDYQPIDIETNKEYTVKVKGDLKIRNVVKEVETDATLIVKDGQLKGSSVFEIKPEDYGIDIPSVVRDKIAKVIEVRVDTDYEPLKSVR